MLAPLLATKLHIPLPRSQSVTRPRLAARLDEGIGRRLTLLSAPAGFGKTTLLSSWIAGLGSRPAEQPAIAPLQVAWLSLEQADGELRRFLTYLAAALQTCQPRLGEGLLAALQSSPAPPGEALLTGFLNEIAALPGRLVLILDDYHLLDSPPVDAALAFLIEHQPAQFHLVIASREDPLLPLARLRARNQLNELRAADLRFSPAEAAEFLNQVMGLDLTAGQITALESRTEGWISGLQLAALAIQGEQQPGGFIDSFTGGHRFVLDYLFEEVLQRQPQEIQAFLLRTSILEQLCGPLCDAILAAPAGASQATLEAIERANLFLIALDGERRWYRYHHLFGDLLRQRLGSPPDLPAFHLRASQWYEDSGSLAPAFQHALAAHDLERAARLAEAAWQAMDHTFQTSAWLGWVAKLPDGLVRSRPLLCSQVGWAYADAGQPETSERYLQSAAQALAEAPNQPGLDFLPGSIALGRAYNAQVRGDLAETLRLAELASQLVPQDDLFRRAQVTIVLEFTHWASGDLQLALRAIYAWMEDMQKAGNMMFVVASAFGAADLLVELGRLNEAEKVLRQAIQQAAAQGAQFEAITAHHHLCLALLAHERGQDEAAAASLQNAESLGRRTTLVDWPHRWKLALARFQASAGAWQAALDLLDEARQVYVQNPVPVVRPVAALQARLYLKQGRLDQAQAWALGRDLLEDGPPAYLAEFETLTLVRVRLAEQALAGLPDLLARLLAAAEAQHRQGGVLEILLTQVLVYQALDQPAQALAALQRALALAEPQGYLRLFVDEGEPLRLLLVALRSLPAEQALPSPAYLERLLAAFPPPPGSLRTPPRQNAELLEPLSERELEVLRLIAQGCSNTEISRRLYLALSTVKGYNLRIFARLGVKNRTEAVARARQLGLI